MQINKNNIHRESYQGVAKGDAQIASERNLHLFPFPLCNRLQDQGIETTSQQAEIEPSEGSPDCQTYCPSLLSQQQGRDRGDRTKDEVQPRDSFFRLDAARASANGLWRFNFHWANPRRRGASGE